MFTAEEFRTKASEYSRQMRDAADPSELRELQRLQQSFTWLADNEEWLAQRVEKSIHAENSPSRADKELRTRMDSEVEEHVLRCLGAAVMMQWKTIPTKLQRELFDTAGSMGELLRTAELRAQIACFLHDHKDDDESKG